jgi:hypothetical protein
MVLSIPAAAPFGRPRIVIIVTRRQFPALAAAYRESFQKNLRGQVPVSRCWMARGDPAGSRGPACRYTALSMLHTASSVDRDQSNPAPARAGAG